MFFFFILAHVAYFTHVHATSIPIRMAVEPNCFMQFLLHRISIRHSASAKFAPSPHGPFVWGRSSISRVSTPLAHWQTDTTAIWPTCNLVKIFSEPSKRIENAWATRTCTILLPHRDCVAFKPNWWLHQPFFSISLTRKWCGQVLPHLHDHITYIIHSMFSCCIHSTSASLIINKNLHGFTFCSGLCKQQLQSSCINKMLCTHNHQICPFPVASVHMFNSIGNGPSTILPNALVYLAVLPLLRLCLCWITLANAMHNVKCVSTTLFIFMSRKSRLHCVCLVRIFTFCRQTRQPHPTDIMFNLYLIIWLNTNGGGWWARDTQHGGTEV